MSITATIQDGKVVYEAPILLPNGTVVTLVLVTAKPKTLAERWSALEGVSVELPPGASEQHDHYLYGTPKR